MDPTFKLLPEKRRKGEKEKESSNSVNTELCTKADEPFHCVDYLQKTISYGLLVRILTMMFNSSLNKSK